MIWGEKEREVFIVKSNLLCLLALVQGMQVLKEKKGCQDPSVTLCFPKANNSYALQLFVAPVMVFTTFTRGLS
jgi:hypothetical protein